MATLTLAEIQGLSDEALIDRYEASGGQAGDPHEDQLADELARRNLDV